MDIPVPQVIKAFNVFSQSRVQQRIREPIAETPAVSLAEEIVEAINAQTQEEINCCLKEDQSEFSEDAPLPSMPQEQIQERIVEKTDIPVPRMMGKTIEAAKHIPQERVQKNTVEQIVDVPSSQIHEETVEVIQPIPQDRMSDHVVQQIH